MTNRVAEITERSRQLATNLNARLRELTASVNNLGEERQLPPIVTPLTNTTSGCHINTGAIVSEPQQTTGITPRRLQYTNDEASLLLFDSEETISVTKTFKQILALVQAQLLLLGEAYQPTKTTIYVQVWSLQQALANVLADIACHLSQAGLSWLIERPTACKIRLDDPKATLPTYPAFPVDPGSNDPVVYRRHETDVKNYNHIHHYDKMIIKMYRDYFIGKFRRLETVPGQANANATGRYYHDYLIRKLGKQLNKETELAALTTRITNISYRPNPNGPIEVFRTVETLRSFGVNLGYPNVFPDKQIRALMLRKIKESGHSITKLKKLQSDWNGKTDAEKHTPSPWNIGVMSWKNIMKMEIQETKMRRRTSPQK